MAEGVGLFRSLAIPASGLAAQRRRMELIAGNIANAHVTGGRGVAPYARQDALLGPAAAESATAPVVAGELPAGLADPQQGAPGVAVTQVVEETGERLVYEPGHPDADASGYVRYPDVDVTQELVALMEVRRLYEANATAFQAMKNLLQRSLEI